MVAEPCPLPSWDKPSGEPPAPERSLSESLRADAVVIGAGITGSSAALHLAHSGKRVVQLEAREPGWGASGRAYGNINSLSYVRGLARAARQVGVDQFCNSPVMRIERAGGTRWRVSTPDGEVSADTAFICTNTYSDGLWPGLSRTVTKRSTGGPSGATAESESLE